MDIFKNWEKNATLRNSPIRNLDSLDKSRFFSPSVSPLLNLNFIKELSDGDLKYIEIQLLYRYLEFTEYLETKLVNPELLKIVNDDYGIGFPQLMRVNAYKIYCDEAFHALQAFNMIDQVHQTTGVSSLNYNIDLKDRLDSLEEAMHPSIKDYFKLFFVTVSECLVSQELNGYVKDESVHTEVISLMRDHAKDEAFHAAFFVEVLTFLHKKLGRINFQYFVDLIPDMLVAYLLPDEGDIKRILLQLDNPEIIEKITSEEIKKQYTDAFMANSATYLNKNVSRILNKN